MVCFDIESLRELLIHASKAAIDAKELLTRIDSLSGDGDLGISMDRGARSILQELYRKPPDETISELLFRCAVTLNREAPSTMGTLISFALLEAAKEMKGKQNFADSDIIRVTGCMVSSIMIVGRAQLGDKTILDSLIPFSETLKREYEQNGDIISAARYAGAVAEQSAMATRGMFARIGRAKWIAERSRYCPDGGAVLCSIIINTINGQSSDYEAFIEGLI